MQRRSGCVGSGSNPTTGQCLPTWGNTSASSALQEQGRTSPEGLVYHIGQTSVWNDLSMRTQNPIRESNHRSLSLTCRPGAVHSRVRLYQSTGTAPQARAFGVKRLWLTYPRSVRTQTPTCPYVFYCNACVMNDRRVAPVFVRRVNQQSERKRSSLHADSYPIQSGHPGPP